jgi:hypothetical protein
MPRFRPSLNDSKLGFNTAHFIFVYSIDGFKAISAVKAPGSESEQGIVVFADTLPISSERLKPMA